MKRDEFIKIMDDLENIDVKLEEGDKSLIRLNSLPSPNILRNFQRCFYQPEDA